MRDFFKRTWWVWAAIAVVGLLGESAKADIVTEFGMGYKIEATTSQVLWPDCSQVYFDPATSPVKRAPGWGSCGGDNPAFIGWPIAWEKALPNDVWRVRVGWFHFSHWFDGSDYIKGGDRRETHADMLAVTATLNWSEMKRKRRARHEQSIRAE